MMYDVVSPFASPLLACFVCSFDAQVLYNTTVVFVHLRMQYAVAVDSWSRELAGLQAESGSLGFVRSSSTPIY
jgi:hypothetical protein